MNAMAAAHRGGAEGPGLVPGPACVLGAVQCTMMACLPPPEMTPAVITGPLCLSEPLPALCPLTLHPCVHPLASTLSPQSTQWGGLCGRTPWTVVCMSMCPCWAPHCAPWWVGTLGSSLLRPTWVDPARGPAGRSRRAGPGEQPWSPQSLVLWGVCCVDRSGWLQAASCWTDRRSPGASSEGSERAHRVLSEAGTGLHLSALTRGDLGFPRCAWPG